VLNIQIIFLTIAILAFGFSLSVRQGYVHSFRAFDANVYSYAKQAEVMPLIQQRSYEEIAANYLHESEINRYLAAICTDMVIASVFAIILTIITIGITALSGCYTYQSSITMRLCKQRTNLALLILAFVCILMILPLWKYSPSFTWFQGISGTIMNREQVRHEQILSLIEKTDYLSDNLTTIQRKLGLIE